VTAYSFERVRGRFYICAIAAALAGSVFAGFAVAAQPCWKAAIGDWYADGTFDRAWDCECLRDAIEQLPRDRPYSSVRDDFQRQLELSMCEGSGQAVETLSATVETRTGSPGSDVSIGVSDDSFPWEVAIVGGLALGLAALVGLALQRQRRRDGS
jgi:hypothetical protein